MSNRRNLLPAIDPVWLAAGGLFLGAAYLLGRPRFPIQPTPGVSVNAGWAGSEPYPRPRHRALDIVAARNTPIRAVDDGVIVRVDRTIKGDAGLQVRIRHHIAGLGFVETRSAHLEPGTIADWVRPGHYISGGSAFAGAGETGKANNPHLHIDAWICDPQTMRRYIELFGVAKNMDVDRALAGKCTLVPIEPLIRVDEYNRNVAGVSRAAGVAV